MADLGHLLLLSTIQGCQKQRRIFTEEAVSAQGVRLSNRVRQMRLFLFEHCNIHANAHETKHCKNYPTLSLYITITASTDLYYSRCGSKQWTTRCEYICPDLLISTTYTKAKEAYLVVHCFAELRPREWKQAMVNSMMCRAAGREPDRWSIGQ